MAEYKSYETEFKKNLKELDEEIKGAQNDDQLREVRKKVQQLEQAIQELVAKMKSDLANGYIKKNDIREIENRVDKFNGFLKNADGKLKHLDERLNIKHKEIEIEDVEIQQDEQEEDKEDSNEKQISDKEKELKEVSDRMKVARQEGNDQMYAEANSQYAHLVEEIEALKNPKKEQEAPVNDNAEKVSDLERRLKECAKRMADARRDGNMQAYAEENSRYTYLIEEIDKLKNPKKEQETPVNDNADKISDLERRLRECAKRMSDAKRDGNMQAYAEENSRYTYLVEEIDKLKNPEKEQDEPSKGNGEPEKEPSKEPNGTGKIIDVYPMPEPTKEPNEKNIALDRTGLQVFTEQCNLMPDIEKKHTLTEILPLPMAITGAAGAGILAINPLAGAAVIAATAVARPIIYRLTGQKALEEEISAQFMDLYKENPGDFNKMIEFLTEEKIQDIKPNAVILRALHKTMKDVTKDEAKTVEREIKDIQERIDELSNKPKEELTKEENEELAQKVTKLDELDKKAHEIETHYKDIKRGKERVSQAYKGNLATRFNIFAHRNSTSKEYLPALNELADAEKMVLEGKAMSDGTMMAKGRKQMAEVMKKYTTRNMLGIQNSVFNDRRSNVRIMSDRPDNTVKYVGRILTIAAGAVVSAIKINEFAKAQEVNKAEVERANNQNSDTIDRINQSQESFSKTANSLEYSTIQKAADGEKTAFANAQEVNALRESGSTRSPSYHYADELANQQIGQYNSSITPKSDTHKMMEQLADNMLMQGKETAQKQAELAQAKGDGYIIDHTEQFKSIKDAPEQLEARAVIYRKLAQVLKQASEFSKQTFTKATAEFMEVKSSVVGPILVALGLSQETGKDMMESETQKRNQREAEEDAR